MRKILAIAVGLVMAFQAFAGTVIETDKFIYTNLVTFSNVPPVIQVDATQDTDGVNKRSMTSYVTGYVASSHSFAALSGGSLTYTLTNQPIYFITNYTTKASSSDFVITKSNVTILTAGYYHIEIGSTHTGGNLQQTLFTNGVGSYISCLAWSDGLGANAKQALWVAGILPLLSNDVLSVAIESSAEYNISIAIAQSKFNLMRL